MKIDVPFYPQKNHSDCGQIALKMVLAYFGENLEIEKIEAMEGRGISTIQIALTAALLNYKTEFYSKSILFNKEHLKKEFYKKYFEDNPAEQVKKFTEKARKAGVKIKEEKLSLDEILNFTTKDSIPIILLDWNIVKNEIADKKSINNKKFPTELKGYHGHFVPVIGYDDENVYVHNQGLNNPQAFMKIPRETFDKARKSDGTDEDVVIIHRKKIDYVWEFTNQKKLEKDEFINYFERKIFKNIRKYSMLPGDRIIKLKKSDGLNTTILKKILEEKFRVEFSNNPNFSSENLSEVAEEIFKNILEGKFTGPKPKDKISRPFYFTSDKEIELYAKLKNIKGRERKINEKVRSLFETFLKKNQDLEINIVKALEQIE